MVKAPNHTFQPQLKVFLCIYFLFLLSFALSPHFAMFAANTPNVGVFQAIPRNCRPPQKDRRPAWKKSSCDCVLSALRLVPKEINGRELSVSGLPSQITDCLSTSLRWSELVKGQKPARSRLQWLSVLQRQKTSGLRRKLSLGTKRLRVSLRLRAETKGEKSPRLTLGTCWVFL